MINSVSWFILISTIEGLSGIIPSNSLVDIILHGNVSRSKVPRTRSEITVEIFSESRSRTRLFVFSTRFQKRVVRIPNNVVRVTGARERMRAWFRERKKKEAETESWSWKEEEEEEEGKVPVRSPLQRQHNGRDFTQGQVATGINEWFNSRLGIILFVRLSNIYVPPSVYSFVRHESAYVHAYMHTYVRWFAECLQVHWSGYASQNRVWRFCQPCDAGSDDRRPSAFRRSCWSSERWRKEKSREPVTPLPLFLFPFPSLAVVFLFFFSLLSSFNLRRAINVQRNASTRLEWILFP